MFSYEEAREFIKEVGKRGSILGLHNMRVLMGELNNVQNTIKTVHIAGTNGKGSLGAYLASICTKAGLTVGRYCSPAVFDPMECWQYSGRNITKEEYVYCMSQVKDAYDRCITKGIYPTAFEVETALAFVYFAWKQPDIFLLECGMGGATDATNVVVQPLACVFTSISYDHMQFLGHSLKEIATVKAGIIKPNAEIFWAPQEMEVEAVLEEACKKHGISKKHSVDGSKLQLISEQPGKLVFSYEDVPYVTGMAGSYQMKNASLAIVTFRGICEKLGLYWSLEEAIPFLQEGIQSAMWQGRFEVLRKEPLFIVDGAHNEDAALQLRQTLENCFTNQRLAYIIGVLADKEHKKMLEIMLPFASKIYTITPANTRGMDGKLLLEEAKEVCAEHDLSIDMEFCSSIGEALEKALDYGRKNQQPILAFGSLSYLGELRQTIICESRNRND